jgi:hypothetical protein
MKRAPATAVQLVAAAAVSVALVLGTGACGDTIDPPAAKINGRVLSQSRLDAELDAMASNKSYVQLLQQQGNTVLGAGTGTFSLPFVSRVLTRQIYLELVHEEFARRKLVLTSADRAAVQPDVEREVGGKSVFAKFPARYRDDLVRRSAEVTKVQVAISGQKLDEAALRTYYDQNQDQFVETCVSHILFSVLQPDGQVDTAATEAQSAQLQASAAAAKARIDAGEDFGAVAREVSQDKTNNQQGGDLQCGAAGRFVPEFEQAMDALQPGQVSAPVKTQFGWHLIKVTSRGPKPFEQVTEDIRQRLIGEAQQGFGGFLSGELVRAHISVNPRYGRFQKGQNPGVVPPTPPTTPPVGGMSRPATEPNPLQLGG